MEKQIKHTEKELLALRDEVSQMWQLVISQLEKVKQAYLENDAELAREVISREKRVDTFELKIARTISHSSARWPSIFAWCFR